MFRRKHALVQFVTKYLQGYAFRKNTPLFLSEIACTCWPKMLPGPLMDRAVGNELRHVLKHGPAMSSDLGESPCLSEVLELIT
eukprot:767643-Amphidinium_carterae.1